MSILSLPEICLILPVHETHLERILELLGLTTGGNSSSEGMKAFCFAGKPFVGA
jgi:hypothetical protein